MKETTADVQRRTQIFRGDSGTTLATKRANDDSGYIFAMMGLLMIPIVIMMAFSMDLGSWYAQGQKMQRSADAASLAGVVWANSSNQWDTVARATATKNGYTDGVNGVSVDVVKLATNQVKVTIKQDGAQYFSKIIFPQGERLSRKSTAEFVLPVPLGSPRNYLGTGGLGTGAVDTPYEKERLWAAVSGYCTDRYQGDQIASRYYDSDTENDCVGQQNPEWKDTNYEYYIELPAGRTYATDVIIYHGNFVRNTDCGGTANANTPNEFCPAGNTGPKPLMPTTMTLYKADTTPLDDSDNPTMASGSSCASGTGSGTKTFNPVSPATSPAESNYVFNPSPGNFTNTGTAANSSWYRICQIPSSAPAGKYILRVRNQDSTSGAASENNGSNAFSIVATPSTAQQLCDARTDTTCPKVYAKDFLSIYALPNGSANFFLAEIGPEHAGKKVTIGLWDSAEGATSIEIMQPNGSNSWTPLTSFNYSSTCGPSNTAGASGTGVSAITNGGATLPFNGCLLSITFTLPSTYSPPALNKWWRIRYQYSGSATDRTTWSVTITGDPVHLIS